MACKSWWERLFDRCRFLILVFVAGFGNLKWARPLCPGHFDPHEVIWQVTTVPLIDTGPLVALCDRRDKHHAWTVAALGSITGPLTTCEAVLTETCFLLKQQFGGAEEIFELLERGLLQIRFELMAEHERVAQLKKRYANLPTLMADACLVRMAEAFPSSRVMTLDRDFTMYRRHGRQVIPLLAPFS